MIAATSVGYMPISARWVRKYCQVFRNAPRGIVIPNSSPSWVVAIRIPTPVENATTTVCEMKFATAPSRNSPTASSATPTMNASVSTAWRYSGEPGATIGDSVANTTSEIALVGPEIECHDDPKSAAMAVGTIAQ